ncbi:MAG: VWA domain-containing protein [Oscillospiraceae bacterium]|nr:VWA domain-containing protein [Oscillospiraceae bacterium]
MKERTNRQRVRRALLCLLLIAGLLLPLSLPAAAANDGRVHILVSLGDSYSSGEGNEKFYGQDASLYDRQRDPDWMAHRSTHSWGGMLVIPGVKGTMARHRGENWYFEAASGAKTVNVIPGLTDPTNGELNKDGTFTKTSNRGEGNTLTLRPQIEVFDDVARDHEGEDYVVDYVTMTLGGNDAEFVSVVSDANRWTSFTNPNALTSHINKVWANYFEPGGIRDNLIEVYKAILEKAPEATLIIAGYPQLLDPDGSFLFPADKSKEIDLAVSRFNLELKSLTEACASSGMHVCFADVEQEFLGHQAYTEDPFLHPVYIGFRDQDLDEVKIHEKYIAGAALGGATTKGAALAGIVVDFFKSKPLSSYSMHPNYDPDYDDLYPSHLREDTVVHDGVHAYAKCVQKKIDELEAEDGNKQWAEPEHSDVRDVVMVLDCSGSMSGKPMSETKTAAESFVFTVQEVDAGVGVVAFSYGGRMLSDFSKSEERLMKAIDSLYADGGTNMEDGLVTAREMFESSGAAMKIVLLMSDGMPNRGKQGDELIEYADELKDSGIRIYALGFFSELSGSEKRSAQQLMEDLASEGCHFEVEDADYLVYVFEDIADQISGSKYLYIRIACPVDVTVSYGGETLCSNEDELSTRTSFGTLSFEESPDGDPDDRVKILRLKEGVAYDVRIEGTGRGTMDYTIAFADESGRYDDWRQFRDIEITEKTVVSTVAKTGKTTVLEVDKNGDGKTDLTYEAKENGEGVRVKAKSASEKKGVPAPLLLTVIALLLAFEGTALVLIRRRKKAAAAAGPEETGTKAAPEARLYCRYCGAQLPPDAVFCGRCGKTLGKSGK